MTTFSLPPEAAEPRLPVAHKSLKLLKTVPELAPRYADHDKVLTLDDIAAVPPLVKDDLNVALAHLQPKAEQGATWLFQSGGSTGAPKVGYAPTGFYMTGVFEQWKPLDRDDVFVNGWGAGRMWGAHFLAGAFADLSGCQVIALGSVTKDEYGDWLNFFNLRSVTAFGGTPSVLRMWFAHARAAGIRLPALRKVLWLGEAWQPQMDEDMAEVAPNAQRWGMFGSTETWVVGTNTPLCPADSFHTLPEQLVHFGTDGSDDLLDFTTLNPEMLNPVLRYQTGDAGQFVECACGQGMAMRILGRRDSVVQVRGLGLHVDDIIARVEKEPGVSRAQILITEQRGRVSTVDILVLAPGGFDTEPVRKELQASTFTLSTAFQHDPDSFQVKVVDSLIANDRTGKTSSFVVREQP